MVYISLYLHCTEQGSNLILHSNFMKNIVFLIQKKMLLIFVVCFCLIGCKSSKEGTGLENVGKSSVAFGDPFIMLHDDVYYAYGTGAEDGIVVYTSSNLSDWKKMPKLALYKKDSWGDRWFWAPEVYYISQKKKFFMYYSADEHICVATSESPLGPFKQEIKEPMIKDEKTIDNSLFIDDDGKAYLYFDRFNNGINVWVAELEDDLKTIKDETLKPCIHTSQVWEKDCPSVNEGPFVMKYKKLYYMTYSANSYECPSYGIGVATSTSPLGPWVKYEKNPIFQNEYGLVGIGHSAMFSDRKGNLRIVFHAHSDKMNIHPRRMYIGDVSFDNSSIPIMRIGKRKVISTHVKKE